jgi:GDPmannose 4,6-dehydratase
MWRMLQAPVASDYVVGTGEHHSVGEYVRIAFAFVGLDPDDFVKIDDALIRPAEVDSLLANPGKAERELSWRAETPFEELVRTMVEADLEAQERSSGRRRGGAGTR